MSKCDTVAASLVNLVYYIGLELKLILMRHAIYLQIFSDNLKKSNLSQLSFYYTRPSTIDAVPPQRNGTFFELCNERSVRISPSPASELLSQCRSVSDL